MLALTLFSIIIFLDDDTVINDCYSVYIDYVTFIVYQIIDINIRKG